MDFTDSEAQVTDDLSPVAIQCGYNVPEVGPTFCTYWVSISYFKNWDGVRKSDVRKNTTDTIAAVSYTLHQLNTADLI